MNGRKDRWWTFKGEYTREKRSDVTRSRGDIWENEQYLDVQDHSMHGYDYTKS
jgi:hypothetical protein